VTMTPEEKDNLTSVFYLLMRDYVPTGTIAKLVQDLEKHPGPHEFTSKYLAAYAGELVERIAKVPQSPSSNKPSPSLESLRKEIEVLRQKIAEMGPIRNDGFQDP